MMEGLATRREQGERGRRKKAGTERRLMIMLPPMVRQERERARAPAITVAPKNRVVGCGLLLFRALLVMLWVCVEEKRSQCKFAGTTCSAELDRRYDE